MVDRRGDRDVLSTHSVELGLAETAARYLADELSATDAAAFEARVEAEPRLYRDIDFSLRLKEGLATLEDREELAPLLTRDRRRVFAAAAIAAAIALLVGVVWLTRTAPRAEVVTLARVGTDLLDESGNPLPVAGRVTLVRTRGGGQANEVKLPAGRASIEWALLPPRVDGPPRYSVFLNRRADGDGSARVGEIRGVAVDANGYVEVFVDSSTLKPGMYAITLQAEGGKALISESEVAYVVTRPGPEG
jgi:hypothetical protein